MTAHHGLGARALLTLVHLVVEWMVHLLLPAMTPCTIALQRTSFVVLTDEGTCLPVLTEVPCVIVEQVWLAAEIVPVVGVDTLGLVVRFDVGAPLSLKVVHIKRPIASV